MRGSGSLVNHPLGDRPYDDDLSDVEVAKIQLADDARLKSSQVQNNSNLSLRAHLKRVVLRFGPPQTPALGGSLYRLTGDRPF